MSEQWLQHKFPTRIYIGPGQSDPINLSDVVTIIDLENMTEAARSKRRRDAALIAAAPALLEALEDARAQLEEYERERTGEHFNDTRINAAIAAAKGEK